MKTEAIPEPTAPYAEHSERLLAHAQEMIDRGDRVQASEKIWGAVAHKLQEVAERRGWGWTNHRGFGNLVLHFRKRTGNLELTMRFDAVEALHTNFYQDVRGRRRLQDGLDNAKQLIALLEQADADDPSNAVPRGLRRRVPQTSARSLAAPQ